MEMGALWRDQKGSPGGMPLIEPPDEREAGKGQQDRERKVSLYQEYLFQTRQRILII